MASKPALSVAVCIERQLMHFSGVTLLEWDESEGDDNTNGLGTEGKAESQESRHQKVVEEASLRVCKTLARRHYGSNIGQGFSVSIRNVGHLTNTVSPNEVIMGTHMHRSCHASTIV